MEDTIKILNSRKDLVKDVSLSSRKTEAEGGCGVVGAASSVQIEGKYLFDSLEQMKNRGNGKGGGIAALGLSHEQLGVSREILQEDYLIQIAYLDSSVRDDVEKKHINQNYIIDERARIQAINDFKDIGLDVKPPEVYRYFCRAKPNSLEEFVTKNKLEGLSREKIEDEYVYQNSFKLNKELYSSLGDKKAFVLSHGKDMMVLKLVGYGDHVIKYYQLEDFLANVWIGHHRYPTKGKVWHPGGAHPFIGLHEALVHNGDFSNYYSVAEYLAQRNMRPLFVTDTEIAVLAFDLWTRVYNYPLEYVIEAMAPTTERDFALLPEEKQRIYKEIQKTHIHGSPDGPWFFIIARNDTQKKLYQLIGITDTSMLRPQVFALQEGDKQIGVIASERQAIDSMLRSLYQDDKLPSLKADLYWNARGGSYTDGGAFIYSIDYSKSDRKVVCTNKFGEIISTPENQFHYNNSSLEFALKPEIKETISLH